jgi:hypothetical protein
MRTRPLSYLAFTERTLIFVGINQATSRGQQARYVMLTRSQSTLEN